MRRAGGLSPLLPLLLAACGGAPDGPDLPDPRRDPSTWPDQLGVDAGRPARVFAPSDYDGAADLPLVMLLHGFGANAVVQDLVFGLAPRVDAYGFVLVLPEGTPNPDGAQFWNATEACCDFYGQGVDDSSYLAGLIDEAMRRFPIDPGRVAITGHSNGGYMAYRMACDHADRLTAIAPLAGLDFLDPADCHASGPVRVLHIHGTDDQDVPYDPTPISIGALASAQRWADRAGCGAPRPDGTADYTVDPEGPETARTAWEGCAPGLDVGLWTLEGVGHIPAFRDAFRDDLAAWLTR